jgi:hypothetical protein
MLALTKRKRKQNRKEKIKRQKSQAFYMAVGVLLSLLIILVTVGPYLLYVFVLRGDKEKRTGYKRTNTDAVFYEDEEEMKRRMYWRFPDLSGMLKDSIVLPGMKAAEALQGDFRARTLCTSMTPQGMTITEDYIFFSAYCHTHKHNSDLFMIDRKTKKLIKTIALGTKAHVGGMAYDPEHRIVWVSGGTKGAAKAIGFELADLEAYDIKSEEPVRAKFNYTLATITRNSYMTYADRALYVGYYTASGLSELERFDLTKEGGLKAQIYLDYDTLHESVVADFNAVTSGRVQGAAKKDPFLYLSKSYGIDDSALQIYQVDQNSSQFQDQHADRIWRLPQKLEQICQADGKIYCLFESAAYAYRAQPALIIDRILVFDADDLTPDIEEPEDLVDIADLGGQGPPHPAVP